MIREEFELPQTTFDNFRKRTGLILGPALFLLFLLLPISLLGMEARRLLAIFFWVVVWWITEPVPLSVTALLGAVLMVLLQVGSPKEVFSPFADPIIFLFMGSFFLAKGMSVHRLDLTIAELTTSSKKLRGNPFLLLIIFGFIIAIFSMWLSNSSAAAIFYPISLGLISNMSREEKRKYAPAILLIVAYSASLGGIGTPIGTPPNLIALTMLKKFTGVEISFFNWMLFAVPLFIIGYFFFIFAIKFTGNLPSKVIHLEKSSTLSFTPDQKLVLMVFLFTVFLWLLPGLLNLFPHSNFKIIKTSLNESVVALIGGLLLFLIPSREDRRKKLLSWKDASAIDWGTLILFGGGLSLGTMMFETKLAHYFGEKWLTVFGKPSLLFFTFLSIIFSVLLTEVVSNTAAANIIIPVIISVASASQISPVPPVVGATIGCSLAFMLPVSTPPNAIVYGSNLIPITEMIKKGILLDIIMILLTFLFVIFFLPFLKIN